MMPVRLCVIALTGLVVAALGALPCQGAVHTVTDLGDSTPGGAPGQLRRLITDAADGDTIIVPAGVITLTGEAGDDANASGDLDIRKNLIIQGAGPGLTIIDGGGIDRVFDVFGTPPPPQFALVTISGLTIRNGRAAGASGGGIQVGGQVSLTLSEVIVSGNRAGLDGGGINVSAAFSSVNLTNVIVHGNIADQHGGGINSSGFLGGLGLTAVIISDNQAGGAAGGVLSSGLRGRLLIADSTIRGNISATGTGGIGTGFRSSSRITGSTISGNWGESAGGIGNAGALDLINVTISGNLSNTSGAALGNFPGPPGSPQGAVASLTNVTISDNVAPFGGVVSNPSRDGTVTLANSLIANSLFSNNCSAFLTSNGHNLSDDDSCQGSLTAEGDINAVRPLLAPLQNYGGPTRTHALLPGSPALDGGKDCPATDQRGSPRPQGTACDIGAFEAGILTAAVEIEGNLFATGDTTTYHGAVASGLVDTLVDVYLGVLLPDSVTFVSFVDHGSGQIGMVIGPAPMPFQAGVVAEVLTVPFQYTFGGAEPTGNYFAYAALGVAGSNPLDPANRLSLDVQSFQFVP
jgi:hypothetical protein